MSYWEVKISEKRTGPDTIIKIIQISSIIVWILLSTFIFLADQARPEEATLFDHLYDITVRSTWDDKLLFAAFIIAVALFIVSIISLLLNAQRLKRKTDKISISFIISVISSALYILIYFYFTMDLFG
jgi:small-conductance mechanosensitive channel